MRKHPSRARRRAALLALLVLSSPATAVGDQPGRQSTAWMPPLPLGAESSVQSNPFCEPPEASPTATGQPAGVKLTSGEPPLVHLKPAGSAVGLVPIGERRDSPQQGSVRVVEAKPPATVQTNPWAEAESKAEPKPVDADPQPVDRAPQPVEPPPTLASDPEPETNSRDVAPIAGDDALLAKEAVSFSLSDQGSADTPQPEPTEDAPKADEPVVSGGWQSATEHHLSDAPAGVTEAPENGPGRWQAPAVSAAQEPAESSGLAESPEPATDLPEPATIVSSGGSQSLRSLPEPVPSPQEAAAAPRATEQPEQPTILSPRPTLVQEAEPMAIAESAADPDDSAPAEKRVSPEPPTITASPARAPSAQRAERRAGPADRLAEPTRRPAEEPSRMAPAPERKASSNASRSAALRYRPPVAIAAPPLAVERSTTGAVAAIVRPTVKTVAATEPDDATSEISPRHGHSSDAFAASKPAPGDADRPRLDLNAAQVRSLTIGGTLRRVQVADDRICQAIAAGNSELKLIGVSDGHTQLSVWADPQHGGETRQQVFDIHVGGAVESAGQSMADAVRMLNHSIADAFPAAQVTVRATRDRLVVSGHCASKDSATEILRLVRKTCLVPVRDELVVR